MRRTSKRLRDGMLSSRTACVTCAFSLEAAPKALVYAAILLAAGACGVRWLVLPRVWVVCGYFNWRRWRAGESTVTSPGSPAESSGRIAAVETFLALGVVLVTALLTELEHS